MVSYGVMMHTQRADTLTVLTSRLQFFDGRDDLVVLVGDHPELLGETRRGAEDRLRRGADPHVDCYALSNSRFFERVIE